MNSLRLALARALSALAVLCLTTPVLPAQDGGPGTGGTLRLEQERRYLDNGRRVLLIGAHPDDEDSRLIAVLSRGLGAETAYLSLTRGEGGQNLIGRELGSALGVLRTEELLAARRVDGAHQYFTRAFDFGFSKTPEEVFRFWPRDSVLKDVVRIIRRFQPQVVISMFSGTPRDGHGQHQVAGLIAREAFDAAGDSTRFLDLWQRELLPPWTALKFYRDYGVTGGITLDVSVLDTVTGHTLQQLGMRSRSQHRSQDMGQLETPVGTPARLLLEARARGLAEQPDSGVFHGVPAPVRRNPERADLVRLIEQGIVLDAWVDDDEVNPGQRVTLTLSAWNGGRDSATVGMTWVERRGWRQVGADDCPMLDRALPPRQSVECRITLEVIPGTFPDQPYYLYEGTGGGGLYRWVGEMSQWGEAFDRPLQARFSVRFNPRTSSVSRTLEVTRRRLDQGQGEMRDPVTIVPPVLLDLVPNRMLWPRALRRRSFDVQVQHTSRDSTVATIRLAAPEGWRVSPPQQVTLRQENERRLLTFEVTAPSERAEGEVLLLAEAIVESDTFRLGAERVDYPHVTRRVILHLAESAVMSADVAFPTHRRIGFIRGAADQVPEALAAAGMPVRVLSEDDLSDATLDSLDVVVVGPRAYETNEALRRAHDRLLRFADAGGTLIVQYQQYQFVEGGYAPLPLTIARPHDRITDEAAPVRWLPGAGRIRSTPNDLSPADFDGWVQERGLYFAATWDSAWTPLLEFDEPGESPKRGGLLVARLGRGTVVYTGIAFFRQIPAAVPGAWRLFANLLAIDS
jgi:LmbE family N-acetylglucosaminyl deacetylase